MVNFPQKLGNQATGIYTTADGLYTIKEQQRLLSGSDWPPSTGSGGGGGGVTNNGLGGSWDYTNTTEYNFDGNQTSPTDLTNDVSFGNLSNFDVEFDLSADTDHGSNQWFFCNGPYNITNGVLVGVWDTSGNEGIAVAGAGIGGYGNTPYSTISDETYFTCSIEFRLSATTANNTIKIYHDNVLQGTQTNVGQQYVNWDYLYIGMGSSGGTQANPSWSTGSTAFKGSIKNISIRDNS